MPSSDGDKNLLLGFLALQMDFISRAQLISAVSVWVSEKSRPLSRILLDQGALTDDTFTLLEALVEKHLQIHENIPEMSLAAVGSIESVRDELKQLGDAEVDATLDHVSGTHKSRESAVTLATGSSVTPSERFRILRPHAVGGLGRISVARDEELCREVAFKELKERYADSPERRSRFVLEAEITGSLEHPGIVPVYGLGQYADGRPFYAMRLIRGDSMKEAIKQFHSNGAVHLDHGSGALELRKLLRRFIDVCNAIQYAHSRGVLHRDLKPSNVMLGKYGETLVVDWGLAKLMGRAGDKSNIEETTLQPFPSSGSAATQMGSAVGTPSYMSPEQAEGRIDELGPASDIYGLGATLYCLLTSRPPVQGDDVSNMLMLVRRGEFPRPREVNSRIPPALEAICLKAMALKPQRRYPTPHFLAEDIEHWLADESVSAHRETLGQRIGRWTRRHRAWTQAGAAALLLVAVVAVAATFFVNDARKEAVTLAATNEQLAEERGEARKEALVRSKDAREAVDSFVTGTADFLKYYPRAQQASKQVFEQAADNYRRLTQRRSDDVELATEGGRAYLRLGDVRRFLGQTDEARDAYHSAEAILKGLSQKNPDLPDCHLELANSRVKIGVVLAETGQNAEADKAYLSVIAELRTLVENYPDDPRFRDPLTAALLNRGTLLIETGSRKEAEAFLRQTIAELGDLLKAESGKPKYRARLAKVRNLLGRILVDQGRDEEALSPLNDALSTFDALASDDRQNPEHLLNRADTEVYRADALRNLGRYADELDGYVRAEGDYGALARAMPDVPGFRERLAQSRNNQGLLLYHRGDTAAAKEVLEQALHVFTMLAAEFRQVPRYLEEQAACSDVLGEVLSDLGLCDLAKPKCELAVEMCQGLAKAYPEVPEYRERRAIARSHLGQVLHKLGDHAAAREAYGEAIQTFQSLVEVDPDMLSCQNGMAFTCEHLGVLLLDMGDTLEAADAFRRALKLRQALAAQSSSPEYLHNLAWFLANCPDADLRDPQRAIELAKRATGMAPLNATYHGALGAAYYRAENWEDAIATLREAIELRQAGNGRERFFLAMAEHKSGDIQQAKKSYQLGRQWMQSNQPGNLQLERIHDEAVEVLGLPEPPTSTGDETDAE